MAIICLVEVEYIIEILTLGEMLMLMLKACIE